MRNPLSINDQTVTILLLITSAYTNNILSMDDLMTNLLATIQVFLSAANF